VAFIKKEMYDEDNGVLSRTWREGKGPVSTVHRDDPGAFQLLKRTILLQAGQADDYAFMTKGESCCGIVRTS
jgi:hypothetical protein